MLYHDVKLWIGQWTGLHNDALHVHMGLALYVLVWLYCMRNKPAKATWLPLLVVFAFQMGNESLDALKSAVTHSPFVFQEFFKDTWNTLLWPTVFSLAHIFSSRRKKTTPSL
jgi:hypothetical protein